MAVMRRESAVRYGDTYEVRYAEHIKARMGTALCFLYGAQAPWLGC